MKRVLLIIGAVILSVVMIGLPVLASSYSASANVINALPISYTETPVMVSENTSYLSANNYILSSGLDVNVKDNTNLLPSMVTSQQLWFVPSSESANSVYNYQWSSGNTPYSSMPIIVGTNGYITTNDNAALEASNNFSIITNGYVNTTSSSSGNSVTNSTGVATGSPITLSSGVNTITVTTLGTFVIFLNGGNTATVTSGTTTVTGSPLSIVGGATTITTTGVTGNFTITLTLVNKDIVYKAGALELNVDQTVSGTIDAGIYGYSANYPTIVDSNGGTDSATTSHTVNLPASIVAGNILLMYFTNYNASGSVVSVTTPSGWTSLASQVIGDNAYASRCLYTVFYKVATGSEGATVTVTTGTSDNSANSTYQISGYSGVPQISTIAHTTYPASATSSIPFNSLAPTWGSQTTLWLENIGYEISGSDSVVSAYSTSFTSQRNDHESTTGTGTAYRNQTTATEAPSNATLSIAAYYGSSVIGIAPAIAITKSVSVTGVSSGVHTITMSETTASGGTLSLQVDSGTPSTVTSAGSVFDNANNWIINQNNTMPYINYYKEKVSGSEKLQYQPNTVLSMGTSNYSTGTATFTAASTTVTGAATAWTTNMIGGLIKDNTDNVYYQIRSIDSPTSLTLTTAYTQTGGAGAAYNIQYYPTATLIDADSTQNGTITMGINPNLGLTSSSTNNVPVLTNFAPASGSGGASPYNPPVVLNPDIAKIPASLGGNVTNYTTGTITVTNGSNLVTGQGTSWISTMTGGQIKLNADGVYYTIAGVTSATNLSLTSSYTNTGGTGAYYMQYLSGGQTSEDILQTNNLFTPWFQPWANLTNIPLLTFFLLFGTAILLGIVIWVMKETQNQLVGSFVILVGESFLYKLGIYELWFVIATGLICFAIVVFERKPAL
jgi:hypothetical protein